MAQQIGHGSAPKLSNRGVVLNGGETTSTSILEITRLPSSPHLSAPPLTPPRLTFVALREGKPITQTTSCYAHTLWCLTYSPKSCGFRSFTPLSSSEVRALRRRQLGRPGREALSFAPWTATVLVSSLFPTQTRSLTFDLRTAFELEAQSSSTRGQEHRRAHRARRGGGPS